MVVFKLSDEYSSPIPAARFFRALIGDFHNLIPKLMPEAIGSIDIVQGDGGAGTIMQINFTEGKKFESIAYEVNFEPTPDGGSKSRIASTYYTKGNFQLNEEEIKAGRERGLGIYIAVEAYLLQNPDAYA
ncbi:major allergen Pru ar 1 [Eucalyptus grandis]|uniref:major allergen Pru ar 1 n=1 Tax=Eucalyptus grandis TaxID=71139 RepID=UPI00192EC2B9|nr:major allergen Pru ar 1 [Eucalyptus grandis]